MRRLGAGVEESEDQPDFGAMSDQVQTGLRQPNGKTAMVTGRRRETHPPGGGLQNQQLHSMVKGGILHAKQVLWSLIHFFKCFFLVKS